MLLNEKKATLYSKVYLSDKSYFVVPCEVLNISLSEQRINCINGEEYLSFYGRDDVFKRAISYIERSILFYFYFSLPTQIFWEKIRKPRNEKTLA